jgi:hypothetical protein
MHIVTEQLLDIDFVGAGDGSEATDTALEEPLIAAMREVAENLVSQRDRNVER